MATDFASYLAKPGMKKGQEYPMVQTYPELASGSSTEPRFSGEPGEDATNFVRTIQKIAFAQGRRRDDDWQADYAVTCLAGSAMRWYCDLEDDKRLSWSDLRRSLLQRFPLAPAPTPPPAAPPPPMPVSGPFSKPPKSKAPVGLGLTHNTAQGLRSIHFYEITKPFYSFTNSSMHKVRFDGKVYPTSEHLFQSLKFLEHEPMLAERIRVIGKQPEMARREAHRFSSEVREDWREVRIHMMEQVVLFKFYQHPALKAELLATGDAELVLDSDAEDAFWGNGADGKGCNELGKALMKLRSHLRSRPATE
ncbi:hypothetical protein FRB94_013170 [Tulasnella sp. JGI-2019a]|nr:hypothetical protein FRB94_013170 [Tulasnella sp. JGI-2019a]